MVDERDDFPGQLLASSWTPLRPNGIVVMSIVGAVAVTADGGWGGLVGGLLFVTMAVLLSFKGVSRMKVYADGLDLNLGPFGICRRRISREEALLTTRQAFWVGALSIGSRAGRIVGPFHWVSASDRWPEEELRAAGYVFED